MIGEKGDARDPFGIFGLRRNAEGTTRLLHSLALTSKANAHSVRFRADEAPRGLVAQALVHPARHRPGLSHGPS